MKYLQYLLAGATSIAGAFHAAARGEYESPSLEEQWGESKIPEKRSDKAALMGDFQAIKKDLANAWRKTKQHYEQESNP